MPDRSKSKLLAVYFIIIFAVGILLRFFVTPLLWPAGVGEVTDMAIAISALFGAMLVIVYYLRTQGSAKQMRILYALGIALPIGFIFLVVITLAARAITGNPVQDVFDILLILAFGYTVGFIIGIPASKKLQDVSVGGLEQYIQ